MALINNFCNLSGGVFRQRRIPAILLVKTRKEGEPSRTGIPAVGNMCSTTPVISLPFQSRCSGGYQLDHVGQAKESGGEKMQVNITILVRTPLQT